MKNTYKTTLLILAAGMGSRYKGQKQIDALTKENETLMEFALYDAIKVGIEKFVLIINSQFPKDYSAHLKTICTEKGCELHFVEQTMGKFIPKEFQSKLAGRQKPLGTAHAVYCAKEIIHEPFITMNADDFYGTHSFETAFRWIQNNKISEKEFGMVAFELQNTLSDNGAVSRGICKVENQVLQSVEEFTKIEKTSTGIEGLNEKLEKETLAKKAMTSMNFWVLHPSFFDLVKQETVSFLNTHKDLSKVEFYLPSVIDKNIQDSKITVATLPTTEKWFGLTYPGDRANVVQEIATQKSNGTYPNQLWSFNTSDS